MNILYLTQVFELENEFGSDRHSFHCKKFKEAGHQVTVITSNLHYRTSVPKYKTKRLRPVKINHQGMDIYYVYSPQNVIGNYRKRILYYISYFIFSLFLLRKLKKVDMVYAVSSPLTVALLGYLMSKKLRAKLYLEIADVWPDVFIELGYLKNKWVIFFLRKMEILSYNHAHYILTLTRGVMENIQGKIGKKNKIFLIPNGVDDELFSLKKETCADVDRLKNKLNLKNKFVCLYIGAHSAYNALDTIVEAARLLNESPEIIFVLIGSGDKKTELQQLAKEYNLRNILFLPPVSRKESPTWLQIADIFLLLNLKGEFYKMNLQNKFFDYLASSKPIIFAGMGETAEIISESKSGKVIEAENAQEMAKAILELKSLPENERMRMGANGRTYVLTHYERNKIFERLISLIDDRNENNATPLITPKGD